MAKVKVPNRAKPVGKKMGYDLYFHRMYQNDVVPADLLKNALKVQKQENFDYNVIKYNFKTGFITFTQSPDFDTADEPIVGVQLLVRPDGSIKYMNNKPAYLNNPWIYHHKWHMVKDDYPGFDVEESKRRSLQWMSALPVIDYKRIGKKQFWDQNVVPYVEKQVEEDINEIRRRAGLPVKEFASGSAVGGAAIASSPGALGKKSKSKKKKKPVRRETIFALSAE